jgi:hypothetical protein
MPGLRPPVSPGMLDQVMGPAPQRPGRSVLVGSGVSRFPRTMAWEDVFCLIYDAPRFLADERAWKISFYGGSEYRSNIAALMLSGMGLRVHLSAAGRVSEWQTWPRVRLHQDPKPPAEAVSSVRCDSIPARSRGTCLTAETRQTDSESASLAGHTA